MKLEKILQNTIKAKLNPRKPLFFTRAKMFILPNSSGEWVEICRGMLILYFHNSCYYFAIMNIMKFEIDFDMEIYTNFLQYSKFMGDSNSMHFLLPCQSQVLTVMMILQSKQELTQLKRKLESQFYKSNGSEQLEFFKKPEVMELIQAAQITDDTLQNFLKFRNDVEEEIKKYFKELDDLEKTTKNSGFKAYGLGREEWKLEQGQKQFLKEKKKSQIIGQLVRLNKQNKMI